jgi:hypothetical protein
VFFTCQAGFQDLLADELAARGFAVGERGGDWVVATPADAAGETAGALDLAFPHGWMPSPREFAGESVNALAQGLADAFLEQLRGERVEGPWPCLFSFPAEVVGLGRRVSAVEKAFEERVRARLSRVARLAQPDLPERFRVDRLWPLEGRVLLAAAAKAGAGNTQSSADLHDLNEQLHAEFGGGGKIPHALNTLGNGIVAETRSTGEDQDPTRERRLEIGRAHV